MQRAAERLLQSSVKTNKPTLRPSALAGGGRRVLGAEQGRLQGGAPAGTSAASLPRQASHCGRCSPRWSRPGPGKVRANVRRGRAILGGRWEREGRQTPSREVHRRMERGRERPEVEGGAEEENRQEKAGSAKEGREPMAAEEGRAGSSRCKEAQPTWRRKARRAAAHSQASYPQARPMGVGAGAEAVGPHLRPWNQRQPPARPSETRASAPKVRLPRRGQPRQMPTSSLRLRPRRPRPEVSLTRSLTLAVWSCARARDADSSGPRLEAAGRR